MSGNTDKAAGRRGIRVCFHKRIIKPYFQIKARSHMLQQHPRHYSVSPLPHPSQYMSKAVALINAQRTRDKEPHRC